MYRTFFSILLIISLHVTSLMSQDIHEYRWQNRLVIVLTDNCDAADYETQLELLKEEANGLTERKLHVIQLAYNQRRDGLEINGKWQESTLYPEYRRATEGIEVLLIGLDGSIKLRQTKLLTPQKLFALIDGMPMRRAEIKKGS